MLKVEYNSNGRRDSEMAAISKSSKYKNYEVKIPEDFVDKKPKTVCLPGENALDHAEKIRKHLIGIRRELELAQDNNIEADTESAMMSIEEIMAILGNLGDILDEVDPQIQSVIDMPKEILPEEKKIAKEKHPEETPTVDQEDFED